MGLTKKISFLYLLLSAVAGSALTFVAFKTFNKPAEPSLAQAAQNTATNGSPCSYNMVHLNGYKFIQPLISADPECEAEKYEPLKQTISSYITGEQQGGKLMSASVYLRDFSKGEWMAINPDQTYDPGSLLKVGVLITFLRMAETNPNLL